MKKKSFAVIRLLIILLLVFRAITKIGADGKRRGCEISSACVIETVKSAASCGAIIGLFCVVRCGKACCTCFKNAINPSQHFPPKLTKEWVKKTTMS